MFLFCTNKYLRTIKIQLMNRTQLLKSDLKKAVNQLESVLKLNNVEDVYKAGCIQYFEFCFELAWKLMQQILFEDGVECNSPKSCIKSTFKLKYIANEDNWLEMLHDRNIMSHTYDASEALNVFNSLNKYLLEFQNLLIRIPS